MSQRVIAVCLALFALATIGFSVAMYLRVNEAQNNALASATLAADAVKFAERARREAQTATTVLPRLHERVVTLEHETIVFRKTLLELPSITVRAMRPFKDAIDRLDAAVADVRAEARLAITAARAANAKSGAAYGVALEAHDVATVAYNAGAVGVLEKILEEFDAQQGHLNTLNEDMRCIRDLGRDRRPVSGDYDDLVVQSLKLQFAMLHCVIAYNSLAKDLGEDFMKQHGLPLAIGE